MVNPYDPPRTNQALERPSKSSSIATSIVIVVAFLTFVLVCPFLIVELVVAGFVGTLLVRGLSLSALAMIGAGLVAAFVSVGANELLSYWRFGTTGITSWHDIVVVFGICLFSSVGSAFALMIPNNHPNDDHHGQQRSN